MELTWPLGGVREEWKKEQEILSLCVCALYDACLKHDVPFFRWDRGEL